MGKQGSRENPVTHLVMGYIMDPGKGYPNLMKNQAKKKKILQIFRVT